MSHTFRSLAVRNYRVYAMGAFLSNVGTWMQNTAQAWLMLELTGSGTAVGVQVGLQLLPTLLLSPWAGVLADLYPKRTLMQLMQVGMAVPAAALGGLAFFGVVTEWQVYALSLAFGVARALEAPSRQSLVTEMVGRDLVPNAVALNSASFNSGRLIGPAMAGILIAAFGGGVEATGAVIALNALSYGSALLALQLVDPKRLYPVERASSARGAVREGLAFVRSEPHLILSLTVVFFLGAFGMSFDVTNALMSTEVFGLGPYEFGVLASIIAIGSILGALHSARRAVPRLRVIVGAGLFFCVAQAVSGVMPNHLAYGAVLPFVGWSVLTVMTTANARVQMSGGAHLRGRLAAIYIMVFMGSVPIGAPLLGAAAELWGPRIAIELSAAISAVAILTATTWYLHETRGWRTVWNDRPRLRKRQASAARL